MKPTLLSHFYNEEYLLPWWLNHHKHMFDHGILIDYNSNDRSVEIIKEICPTWEVRKSKNEMFKAYNVDREVEEIEQQINGWRICLNITEFLLGDLSKLNELDETIIGHTIPSFIMVDSSPEDYPTYDKPLIEQKRNGIPYYHPDPSIFSFRRARLIHRVPNIMYQTLGRHFDAYTTEDFVILWYGYSPYNEKLKQRKLQIKHRIPYSDKICNNGMQHFVESSELDNIYINDYLPKSKDLSVELQRYIG